MLAESGKRTALFIDEIHRMTKSIQDLLLAPIETGVIVLIGATTEHPAYELTNAIQSRTSVLILKPLETPSLEELLRRAEILMGKPLRSEEPTSELQSLMRISYAVFCLKTKNISTTPSSLHHRTI